MATLKAANRTIMDAITPATVLDKGLVGGNVRCMIDTYTGLGTESSGDTIEFGGELPKGARVVGGYIVCTSMGGTPDVGDAEDPDRYVDEAADNTATSFTDVLTGIGYEVDMTTSTTPDNQILVTLDAAVTAAGTITVVVLYTAE
jgi:hypothetical protein